MAIFKKIKEKLIFYNNNWINSIKNLLKSKDCKALLNFMGYILIYGLCSNGFFVLFGFPFTWFSWISFGLGIWIIENKFINFFRRLWFR